RPSRSVSRSRRMCWRERTESFGDTRSFTFVQDKFWIFVCGAAFRLWIGSLENKSMKRCRWKSFFENPKSAIQKRPRRPKWLGLSVIALALVVAGAVVQAQQPTKIPRIGYLGGAAPVSARREAFRQGLRDLGYVEGKNIIIEWRSGEGKADRVPGLAAELVRLKVEVIVTDGSGSTRSAKQATSTIPIVM